MNLDTSLSLEVILAILAILGAAWRLEGKIVESHREIRGDLQRLDGRIGELRRELKGDIQRLCDKLEGFNRRPGEKIDDGNRCLAAEGEAESPA